MGVGGPAASNWERFDSDTVTSPDGAVQHGKSFVANVQGIGESVVSVGEVLGKGLSGHVAIAPDDVRVDGVGEYLLNLGMAVGLAGVLAPLAIVKDTVDAALHGIGAGFQAIF